LIRSNFVCISKVTTNEIISNLQKFVIREDFSIAT